MSAPGAGFSYPPQPVLWNRRDVLLFATSIGCTADELHFLYELHPSFQTFPTYPIILPFKRTHTEVTDFYAQTYGAPAIPDVPKLDPRRVIDGQRLITFEKPLPPTSEGREFELRGKVLGVYDKGKAGTVVETETVLVEKNGARYCRMVGSAFYVGQGGWGGPKGPSTVNYPPPKDRTPDATYTFQTTTETAHLYRLNGDYNPLHATPLPGQKMGFGGPILHGLFTWNVAAHGLLQKLGSSDPGRMREFAARFAAPVRPGDKLVTEMWWVGEGQGEAWEEVRFVVKVDNGDGEGKVVLSNGRAVMRRGEKGKL